MIEDIKNLSEFISIQEAAKLYGKSVHNISYLVQYSRINKYYRLENEQIVNANKLKKTKINNNNSPLVSVDELTKYFETIRKNEEEIIKRIPNCNKDLLFFDISEKERTKHVHKLHPYMGKFIPQLVEYYLDRNFKREDIILDPFMGSGTTLIEANVKEINCIGIDISQFNCMIAKAKIQNYDFNLLEKEVNDILKKTENIFQKFKSKNISKSSKFNTLDVFVNQKIERDVGEIYETNNTYLKEWFASNTIKQMLIYNSLIPDYTYQNCLKVLLSRSIRSARLTFHFELTRLKKPVYEPYVCHKHKNKVCVPIQSLMGFLGRYSNDTLKRIQEFSKIRSNRIYKVINGDSSKIDLSKVLSDKFQNRKINGIITSPPYVGLIDYHLQHIYAYELFNIEKKIDKEIGRQELGTSIKAKEDYKNQIAQVFRNLKRFLKTDANVFIVANDKWNLYPDIAELSGYEIIDRDERPVTRKASRDRRAYSESIFHFLPL